MVIVKCQDQSSHRGSVERNLTSIREDTGLVPGLAQWVKDPAAVSCVGLGGSSDPTLLWLWCRPEATALIWPLAWETPYAMGEALKRQNKEIKKVRMQGFEREPKGKHSPRTRREGILEDFSVCSQNCPAEGGFWLIAGWPQTEKAEAGGL